MSPYSCSVDPSGSGSARMKSRNPTQFPGPLYWELLTHGDVSLPDDLSRGGVSAHSFRVAGPCSLLNKCHSSNKAAVPGGGRASG